MFDVNVGGTHRARGVPARRASSASSSPPARRRWARRARAGRPTRPSSSPPRRLGIPYVNSVHEAEAEALRLAAQGLPLVCVNPAVVLRPRRLHVTLHAARAQLPARTRPRLRGRRHQRGGRPRRRRGPPARRRARRGGRALHPRRAQLHLRPPVRRPRPAVGHRSAGQGPRGAGGRGRRRCWASGRAAAADARPRCARPAQTGPTARRRPGASSAGRRAPHEETLEATVAWHLEREHDRIARTRRSQQIQYRVAGRAIGAAEEARACCGGSLRRAPDYSARVATLYRCKAPTDLVCRCGKVARRLGRWRSTSTRCACPSSSATAPRSRS